MRSPRFSLIHFLPSQRRCGCLFLGGTADPEGSEGRWQAFVLQWRSRDAAPPVVSSSSRDTLAGSLAPSSCDPRGLANSFCVSTVRALTAPLSWSCANSSRPHIVIPVVVRAGCPLALPSSTSISKHISGSRIAFAVLLSVMAQG